MRLSLRSSITAMLALCVIAASLFAACSDAESPAASTTNGNGATVPMVAKDSRTTTATAPSGGNAVDLKNLPIGDGKYGASAQRGYIWTCQQNLSGGGAFATGAWVHSDKTFDVTAKPVVSGSVSWPHAFTITISGGNRVFTGNDLPDHNTGTFPIPSTDTAYQYDRNPNSIKSQTLSLTMPMNPALAAAPSCVRGESGIMLTGALIFDGLDAGGRDAVAHEIQDACGGHPQMGGVYHYHSLPGCIPDAKTGKHSELLGYALDGFGIFGKYGENGEELTDADLDDCHGHTHTISWDGKQVSMYHYHATAEYPYTVGCFRGTQIATVAAGR